MKIAFIGGYGHPMLRFMLADAALRIEGVALASDGFDKERAQRLGTVLGEHQWYDDAHQMLREFKPDIVNVIGVFSSNAEWSITALEDHTVSLFQLENGGSCVIHADFLRPDAAATHADDRLRIVGTSGQVEIIGRHTFLTSDAEGYRDKTHAEPGAGCASPEIICC